MEPRKMSVEELSESLFDYYWQAVKELGSRDLLILVESTGTCQAFVREAFLEIVPDELVDSRMKAKCCVPAAEVAPRPSDLTEDDPTAGFWAWWCFADEVGPKATIVVKPIFAKRNTPNTSAAYVIYDHQNPDPNAVN